MCGCALNGRPAVRPARSDHASEPGSRERRAALRGEDERRSWLLFALLTSKVSGRKLTIITREGRAAARDIIKGESLEGQLKIGRLMRRGHD
jgi:hypothetical protein